MRKIISKLFNKFTFGIFAVLFSSAALAQNGNMFFDKWPLLLLGGLIIGGIIWALNESNDDDGEIFS